MSAHCATQLGNLWLWGWLALPQHMCKIWWPSRTQQEEARKEVGLSIEVEVGQVGLLVEEEVAEDLVEALGLGISLTGQA